MSSQSEKKERLKVVAQKCEGFNNGHCKCEMVKFDYSIEAEILIFQIVNFDCFVVINDHF